VVVGVEVDVEEVRAEERVRVEEAEVAFEAEAALLKVVGIAGRGLIGVFVVDEVDVVAAAIVVGLTLAAAAAAAVAVAAARNAAVVNGFLADV
jgi:hypothetical protein